MIKEITIIICDRCGKEFVFNTENEQLTSHLILWCYVNTREYRYHSHYLQDNETLLCDSCSQFLFDWLKKDIK